MNLGYSVTTASAANACENTSKMDNYCRGVGYYVDLGLPFASACHRSSCSSLSFYWPRLTARRPPFCQMRRRSTSGKMSVFAAWLSSSYLLLSSLCKILRRVAGAVLAFAGTGNRSSSYCSLDLP